MRNSDVELRMIIWTKNDCFNSFENWKRGMSAKNCHQFLYVVAGKLYFFGLTVARQLF